MRSKISEHHVTSCHPIKTPTHKRLKHSLLVVCRRVGARQSLSVLDRVFHVDGADYNHIFKGQGAEENEKKPI